MEIIKIDSQNPDPKIIDHAVEILKHGGIVVYPTDTSYGIGVDITNPVAVKRLFQLKNRGNKPVAVIVPSIEYLKNNLVHFTESQEKIIKDYLPGPVTFLVYPVTKNKFMHEKLGFRIPSYRLTQMLANKLNGMYATTSANISDLPSCYSIPEFLNQIEKSQTKPDLILDAGELPKNPASTIIDLTTDPPTVMRKGGVEFKI